MTPPTEEGGDDPMIAAQEILAADVNPDFHNPPDVGALEVAWDKLESVLHCNGRLVARAFIEQSGKIAALTTELQELRKASNATAPVDATEEQGEGRRPEHAPNLEAVEAARRILEYWGPDYGNEDEVIVASALLSLSDRAEEWRPIETAPRDGRMALVLRPLADNSNDDIVAIKRLIGGNNFCWPYTVPPGEKPTNPTDGACHVTHWMPLPSPPGK